MNTTTREAMRVACVLCGQAWIADDGKWIARNVERHMAAGHDIFRLQKITMQDTNTSDR